MGVVQDLRGTLVQETHADAWQIDFKGFYRFCLGIWEDQGTLVWAILFVQPSSV